MQRVIIDTNVIVSSIIQRGFSYLIINELFIEEKIELWISNAILHEYYEVLSRKRFKKYHDFFSRAEALLVDIESKSKLLNPKVVINIISDIDDNKFLELADECNADFLITGNTNDFTINIYKQTKIVTPREYWEKYRPF